MKRLFWQNTKIKLALIYAVLVQASLSPSLVQAAPAQILSEVALFHRCYAHLTQMRPSLSDTLLAQVKAGTKTAVQACSEVLDRARFTANAGTKIPDNNDKIAKAVLNSMHQLHSSWSREHGLFNLLDNRERYSTEAWYDDTPLADYITRALFSPSFDVSSVVQGADFPQPVRVNMSPPLPINGIPNTDFGNEQEFVLGAQQPLAPRGELLGIQSRSIAPINLLPVTRFTNLFMMPDFANLGVPPKATRTLTNLNLTDITAVRGPIVEIDHFAVQIKGRIQINTAATYTLFLSVDDAAMLFIDQVKILDSGVGSASIALTAGAHDIEVRYRQYSGSARLIMSWQTPSMAKQVIPASAFLSLQAEYYTESQPPPVRLTGNQGGGFIGNHNYIMTTFLQGDSDYVPDGAVRVNRSWAKAVLQDALCREIPVVRESDAAQFVVSASTTPFRQAATCTSCHATIDRQAGLIRGLRWNPIFTVENTSPAPDLIGILGVNFNNPSLPALANWSDLAESDYGNRQPDGKLYFRNYRGELVDRTIHSLAELGTALSEQDDFYACFAKRYYQYFLGIDVELGDPGNVVYPQLNAADTHHRAKVIELGLRLKSSKSLNQLIREIIASNEYRMADYGISYQEPTP